MITTRNLENLFRPGNQYGPRTQAVHDAKVDYLAGRLTALAPDVVAVQEVGDPSVLDDLAGRLGAGWHTVLS